MLRPPLLMPTMNCRSNRSEIFKGSPSLSNPCKCKKILWTVFCNNKSKQRFQNERHRMQDCGYGIVSWPCLSVLAELRDSKSWGQEFWIITLLNHRVIFSLVALGSPFAQQRENVSKDPFLPRKLSLYANALSLNSAILTLQYSDNRRSMKAHPSYIVK